MNPAMSDPAAAKKPAHPPSYVEVDCTDAAPFPHSPTPEGPKNYPPLFPNPTVLDEVLYDYLRRADKMGWSPYDLVDQENVKNLARPERLSETQLQAVQTVLYV